MKLDELSPIRRAQPDLEEWRRQRTLVLLFDEASTDERSSHLVEVARQDQQIDVGHGPKPWRGVKVGEAAPLDQEDTTAADRERLGDLSKNVLPRDERGLVRGFRPSIGPRPRGERRFGGVVCERHVQSERSLGAIREPRARRCGNSAAVNTRPASHLRVGLVGAGRWGANYLRALPATPGVELACVFDHAHDALERARAALPTIVVADDLEMLLALVDAVVIATPSTTHAELAMRCLDAGKHVLVEKPLSTDPASAAAAISLAAERGLVLLVGHLTLCNPALALLRDAIASGLIGRAQSFNATRTSDGARHRRDSALWSLGPHDVANVLFVSGATPTRVRDAWSDGPDGAGIELDLSTGSVARMRWSRSSAAAERSLVVEGTRGCLVFDEARGSLELQCDDDVRELVSIPPGGLLDRQCAQFVAAARDPSLAVPATALLVVRVLAAAQARLDRPAADQALSATL
jgi:predicted dehydrogenase